VLILGHPLLGYLEATVRTLSVGPSRNLWNVGGHGLGIFTLRVLGSVAAGGLGETELALKGTALILGSVAVGGRAALTLEGTTLTSFLGRSF